MFWLATSLCSRWAWILQEQKWAQFLLYYWALKGSFLNLMVKVPRFNQHSHHCSNSNTTTKRLETRSECLGIGNGNGHFPSLLKENLSHMLIHYNEMLLKGPHFDSQKYWVQILITCPANCSVLSGMYSKNQKTEGNLIKYYYTSIDV